MLTIQLCASLDYNVALFVHEIGLIFVSKSGSANTAFNGEIKKPLLKEIDTREKYGMYVTNTKMLYYLPRTSIATL